jgi:flagellin
MNASTHLQNSSRGLSTSLERLSSGLRINRGADDAAGMGVANNLRAANASLKVAHRNASDAVSVIQTAEGSASEVGAIVERMRELAVQSASETLADDERQYIQEEFTQLVSEIDRIAAITNFNGVQLSDGSNAALSVQVGIGSSADNQIDVVLGDLSAATLGVDVLDLSTSTTASAALTSFDAAIDMLNGYHSSYGAVQNRIQSAMRNLETYSDNLSGAESVIRDADFAMEAAEMAKFQTMQQAGVSVLAQANQLSQSALKLIG